MDATGSSHVADGLPRQEAPRRLAAMGTQPGPGWVPMDSLVDGCVDAIACGLLTGAVDLECDELLVETLVEEIALLPLSVGQRFADCIQLHVLKRKQRVSSDPEGAEDAHDELNDRTPVEQALWVNLVKRHWLVRLSMTTPPHQLLTADVGWSQLPLQRLDCSNINNRVVSLKVSVLLRETLSLGGLVAINLSGWDDEVADELLEALALRCQLLEDVDVSHCFKVTDRGLSTLVDANAATLRRLSVNGLRLLTSEGSVDAIEKCPGLHTLELEDCVSLTRLPDLPTRMPSVTALNFQCLSQFTDAQLHAAMAGVFPRIRWLRLGESELSGATLRQLMSNAPSTSLHEVDLSWCTHIEGDAIAGLVRLSVELRVLKLRCTHVDDTALELIGCRSASLVVLDLERCDALTANGFDALVASAQKSSGGFLNLKKINLSWTSVAVGASSRLLEQCSETIRKVRLQGCKELNSMLLDAMLGGGSRWPQLQLLDCSWINDIADDKLQAFREAVPNAVVVGYYGLDA